MKDITFDMFFLHLEMHKVCVVSTAHPGCLLLLHERCSRRIHLLALRVLELAHRGCMVQFNITLLKMKRPAEAVC